MNTSNNLMDIFGQSPNHSMVSVWVCENRLVLGQVKTTKKSKKRSINWMEWSVFSENLESKNMILPWKNT